MEKTLLLVVGDRGRARLFSLERGAADLREIADLYNPALRLHERALSRDRQGRGMSRVRGSRAAFGEAHRHKRVNAARFARQVADAVQECTRHQSYARIYLMADPEFTGLLRPQLAARRLGSPVSSILKHLTRHAAADIRAHLPARLWRSALSGLGAP